MSTMNISLPATLKSFVDERVSQRGYVASSEHARELIRKDHDRLQLRGLLLAGVASNLTTTADASYFESLRDRVRKAAKPAARSVRTGVDHVDPNIFPYASLGQKF